MVGFISNPAPLLNYLRRRSPGPPFPPDHRQAGERGAITAEMAWSTGTPKFLKPLFETPFKFLAYNSTLGVAVHCSAAVRKAAIPPPIVTLYSGRAGSCPRATHERGGQACTLVGLRVCALWFGFCERTRT
eukprot:scaffold29902_cov60-Phaeocystis_antarctica.AAC.2